MLGDGQYKISLLSNSGFEDIVGILFIVIYLKVNECHTERKSCRKGFFLWGHCLLSLVLYVKISAAEICKILTCVDSLQVHARDSLIAYIIAEFTTQYGVGMDCDGVRNGLGWKHAVEIEAE